MKQYDMWLKATEWQDGMAGIHTEKETEGERERGIERERKSEREKEKRERLQKPSHSPETPLRRSGAVRQSCVVFVFSMVQRIFSEEQETRAASLPWMQILVCD